MVVAIMFYRLGGVAYDSRLAKMLVKTVMACGVVMAIDRLVLHDLGPVRLIIDALVYVGLVLASGAVSVGESLQLVKTMRANRRAG